jgi:hypothetical protein
MNLGNTYQNDLGRQLYMDIAMIEEQHVSHYGALLDPKCTWLENLLLHEYMECYLYYSFWQDELDSNVKGIWERFYEQEVSHLHKAAELLKRYENRDWQQVIPGGEFPVLLQFHDTRDYVRNILAQQSELTAYQEVYKPVCDLPKDYEFFWYQNRSTTTSPASPPRRGLPPSAEIHRGIIAPRAAQPGPGLSDRLRATTRKSPRTQKVPVGV